MGYGCAGSDSGCDHPADHQTIRWRRPKTIIDELIEAIHAERFDRALALTDELEGAVWNMYEGNWENIQTPLLDGIALKDHKRNLILHGELLLLNCSVVRIQRLRKYIRKYIEELKHGEAQKNG